MYKSLQTGRGLAALMVVCYHACATVAIPRYLGTDSLPNVIPSA
jgi:peptidoglycan/LPS O-acetylase OafA/YrhL